MHEIKMLRKAVGMKQCILAEKLSIDQSNYANMENGKLKTNKIPQIREKAIEILLPLLTTKVNNLYLNYLSALKLKEYFEKDYR